MACKKYHRVLNKYVVGLYDKNITSDPQRGCSTSNVTEALGGEDHLKPLGDSNDKKKDGTGKQSEIVTQLPTKNYQGSGCGEQRDSAPQLQRKNYQKQLKFTTKQLRELKKAFKETHYPDDLQMYVWGFLSNLLLF